MLLKDGVPPCESVGVIWFSILKLLCVFGFFLRRLAASCTFRSRIVPCAAGAVQATRAKFESDSYFIGVNIHVSCTLSGRKCDFKNLQSPVISHVTDLQMGRDKGQRLKALAPSVL